MKINKILATILAVAMVISCMSLPAFAKTYPENYAYAINYIIVPPDGYEVSDVASLPSWVSTPTTLDNTGKIPAGYQLKTNYKDANNAVQLNPGFALKSNHRDDGNTLKVRVENGDYIYITSDFLGSTFASKWKESADTPATKTLNLYLDVEVAGKSVSVKAYPNGWGGASIVTPNESSTVKQYYVLKGVNLLLKDTRATSNTPYLYAETYSGHVFDGWYLDNGNGEPTGERLENYTIGDDDVKFVAKFSEVETKYTVTLVAGDNGSVSLPSLEILAGTSVTTSDLNKYVAPDTGYEFKGWYIGEDLVVAPNNNSTQLVYTPTGDVTLTAMFEEIPEPEPEPDPEPEEPVVVEKYTVTFDSDHGSAVQSVTVDEGSTVVKPTDPKRIGYTFAGWYNGGTVFDFTTPITSDLTLTAQWTPEEFFDDLNDEVRIAGQIDLFGADLRSYKDYSGSLTLYRGYDGFSDDNPSITVAKRNYIDGVYNGTDTNVLDVANVGMTGLDVGVEGLNYDVLYNLLQGFATNYIASNNWVINSGESSVTYNMSSVNDGAYGYTAVTATPDTQANAKAVMDAISSSANFTYSRNGGSGSLVVYFPAGSYLSMNGKGQTIGSAGVTAPLKDYTGEFSMEDFRKAFFDGGLSDVQDMENEGSFYMYLKAGFYIDYGTNGEERTMLNKDMVVKIDGLVDSDEVLTFINSDHSSGISLNEITGLLNFIPQDETITIEINYIEPEVVAKIDDVNYTSLQAAVDAAKNGDIIELVDSYEQNAIVTIPEGKTVTLDLAGKTLTLNAPKDRLFVNNGNLTIKNGTIAQENTGSYGVVKNNGTLTIDGITITDAGQAAAYTIKNESGTLLIKSGTSITATGTAGGNATLYNAAEMTVEDGVTLRNNATDGKNSDGNYGVYCVRIDGGTSTFGTINGNGVTIDGNRGAFAVNGGTLIINSGTYTGHLWRAMWITNDYAGTYVTINGGSFVHGTYGSIGADVDDGKQDNSNVAVTVNDGYFDGSFYRGTTHSNHEWTFSIKGGYFATAPAAALIASGFEAVGITAESDSEAFNEGYLYKVSKVAVAAIDDTKYETLAEAIAAIKTTGGTIKLLADFSEAMPNINFGKEVIIDANGHVYTMTNSPYVYCGELVLTNGTFNTTANGIRVFGATTDQAAVYSKLTVEAGATIISPTWAIIMFNNGSSNPCYDAVIDVNGEVYGNIFVSGNIKVGDSVVNINNGAFVSTDVETNNYAHAIAGNGFATVNINGGTIIGKETGIETRAGTLNISDGTITGNGSATTITANGSGTTTSGAGVAVAQHTTMLQMNVNITGGTITGKTGLSIANPEGNKVVNMNVSVSGGTFNGGVNTTSYNTTTGKAVDNIDSRVSKFITGGIYSTEPDNDYIADSYKAVALSDGDNAGKYQVGYATITPSISGTVASEKVTYTVDTTVKENEQSTTTLETINNLTVDVTGQNTETKNEDKASVAVAALSNIKSNDTLSKIVSDAIEAAGAKITKDTNEATITIQVAKSAADTSTSGKRTYEVHPEAVISVDNHNVGTVKLANSQITGTFSFKLYAGAGKIVKVTHVHSDGNEEDLGNYTADAEGYITLSDITEFSEFTLEEVTGTTVLAKFGYTLTLEDNINIVFNVKELVGSPSDYSVTYTFKGTEQTVTLNDNQLNAITVASCAAKEMGEVVHIVVKHNGTPIKETDLSVKGYCEYNIANSSNTYLVNICKAVLDYGRYAQETFGYNTSNLVNGGSDYFTNANITVPTHSYTKEGIMPDGITGVSASLITTSATQLVVYFAYSGEPTGYTVSVGDWNENTSAIDNESVVDDWTTENGKIKVVITGIAAKNLGVKKAVTISNGGYSYVLKFSPVDYMGLQVNYFRNQVNINRAFYNYYIKAVDYFAHK